MAQFRTKARAVELLGKGQIADLPTAITELWKNGYDAYADNLEAHLFCKGYKGIDKPLFVISDDGTGMSEEDVLNKWMVIGTDTKINDIEDVKGEDTLGKEPRIKTGEKGIGRLSVSYLGSQMLLLTKKRNTSIQALFFDWRILDNYNLYLEDIQIPLHKIDINDNPIKVFEQLKTEYLKSLNSNNTDQLEEYKDLYHTIVNETKQLISPDFIIEQFIENYGPKEDDKHGTMFIIFNPIDQLVDLHEADKNDDVVPDSTIYTVASLSGLANQFYKEKISFSTRFYIYKSEIPIDIIQQREFFTYDDFDKCDHIIDGKFDDNGKFKGTVKVYNKEINHEFSPNRPPGKCPYGPFDIKIGYIMGELKETLLSDEEKRAYDKRLNRYSGLYIYRDGFRVLPYGRTEQDFLEFEYKRSKGAGRYFFSIRRMFGYIAISRTINRQLKDKAGREGFISNRAFREFTDDLKAFFFDDLAKKYFATYAEFSYKDDQKKQIIEEKLEKERERTERKEFNKILKEYPIELEKYCGQLYVLLDEFEILLDKTEVIYAQIEELLSNIDDYRSKLIKFSPPEPKRFKPTDHQREKLFEYSKNYKDLYELIERRYQDLYGIAKVKLQEKELQEEFDRKVGNFKKEFQGITKNIDLRIKIINSNFLSEIRRLNKDYLVQLDLKVKQIEPKELNRKELASSLELLENLYSELRNDFENKINPFIEHLERLDINIDEDKLVGYFKIQYEEIKNLWQQTQELAQLGIAVEIIDHQFNALYSQLANIIGMFKDSIRENEKSKKLYNILVSSFDHLQNNYKFLTPLYRTTGRTRKEISGLEIEEYIAAFYSERFQNDNINLTSTEEFKNSKIYTYESILKPVFINIVNNAVYWLTPAKEREIHLAYEEDMYLIMNSGQPIDEVFIKEDIFKLFFSRKPKGRGIGLYLAMTTLNSIGYDIEATNDQKYNRLNGACFLIKKYEK